MRSAVVTTAHGRHEHLAAQRRALAALPEPPDVHVVVAMGDPGIADVLAETTLSTRLVEVDLVGGRLPLARARNRGARAAGAVDLLVLLDVDCLPGEDLLRCYAAAAAGHPDRLLAGPVGYLPAGVRGGSEDELRGLAVPSPVRPVVEPGQVEPTDATDLFWSLSFAVTPAAWARAGGFCERYTGYGMEDTDFAWTARAAGVGLAWVGGAWAYHQDHGPSGATAAHAEDLVRNAAVFHDRWGRWPAPGWFDSLEAAGLVLRGPDGRPEAICAATA